MMYTYFIIAVIFMIIGHILKTLRWKQFIKVYEIPRNLDLLNALSIGHLINFIIPYRIGDIVRVYLIGRRLKNGFALAIATIIIDLYIDVVTVGAIFGIFSLITNNYIDFSSISCLYFIVAVSAVVFCIIGSRYKRIIKKMISKVAAIFNTKIELLILYISWTIIYSIKNIIKESNIYKIFILTIGIWSMYFVSYSALSECILYNEQNIEVTKIFFILFSNNVIYGFLGNNIAMDYTVFVVFIMYISVPLIIILFFYRIYKYLNTVDKNIYQYKNILPHLNNNDRLNFLETYFKCENKVNLDEYLNINCDINIIQDYSAGSNATTMLCMKDDKTFYRKYAFEKDGEKLFQQINWINHHKDIIPLTSIIRFEKTENYCFYDMPYNPNAISLFQYVHCAPIDDAWKIIREVFDTLNDTLYQYNRRKVDEYLIKKYISEKVIKNINIIMKSKILKSIVKYEEVMINGIPYKNLSYYLKYLSEDYLMKIFLNDEYSDIHGDLTIENIICLKSEDSSHDFYIIDPNTGNIHDASNLDYGKILQSIHGGYEFLMSTPKVTVTGNCIDFLFTRSSVYDELYSRFNNYMQEIFSYERIRSIYFHEIIHWLRLMPYKLEKDKDRVFLFYAGLLIVLKDIWEMFYDEKSKKLRD